MHVNADYRILGGDVLSPKSGNQKYSGKLCRRVDGFLGNARNVI